MSDIRLRFAPSPTGFLHVGGARTALFNYLYARRTGGAFILRIEDTDIERSTEESVENLLGSLRWLGLDWDEGPGKGGECGPYFQSQRIEIYNGYVQKLLDEEKCYTCFCTDEELEAEREEMAAKGLPPKYSGKCAKLRKEEVRTLLDSGKPFGIRFRVPPGEKIAVEDLVHGHTEFDSSILGDFIIKRSNGFPTYNFTCVVDDYLMKISHVIRGDDHLSNTPKQMLIYRALGFDTPIFGHVSMILGPDGSRLSKRHGATSVEEFRNNGFLPEAVVNFLSLLGWSPPEKDGAVKEIMDLPEMCGLFGFDRVSKNPAIMNTEKLLWMNGMHLRKLPGEKILELSPSLLEDSFIGGSREKALKYIEATRDYYNTLGDVTGRLAEFAEPGLSKELLSEYPPEKFIPLLDCLLEDIHAADLSNMQMLPAFFKNISKKTGLKGRDLYHSMRVFLTGKNEGPEMQHFFFVLSKDELSARFEKARAVLKG